MHPAILVIHPRSPSRSWRHEISRRFTTSLQEHIDGSLHEPTDAEQFCNELLPKYTAVVVVQGCGERYQEYPTIDAIVTRARALNIPIHDFLEVIEDFSLVTN